jgi:hypothetical protein
MTFVRHKLVQLLGVTLASLTVARFITACASSTDETQYQKHSTWDRLRQYWFDLDNLRREAREWNPSDAQTEASKRELGHRAVLGTLIETGEIDVVVADQVQSAFEEAVFHTWRSNIAITCYRTSPTSKRAEREDLIRQLDVLRQVTGDIDPAVVERAQAAIAHDLASFEAPTGKQSDDAAHILVNLLVRESE